MSVIFLKVKIKSLASESRIIRQEEYKSKGELRDQLHIHRVREVRNESRATHLAYDFLRSRRPSCNFKTEAGDTYKKILAMINKYGDRLYTQKDLEVWLFPQIRAFSNQVNAPAFNPA